MSGPDLEALARRHGAILLLQFGFTVTGREHPQSDLDIAVLFDGEPTFERMDALLAELRLRAFRRYQDHRRYLAMEKEHVDRFLAARTRF